MSHPPPRHRPRAPIAEAIARSWKRARSAAFIAIGIYLPGCLVDEKCYSHDDCSAPKVCNARGECALECREDRDCDDSEALKQVCRNYRCIPAPACTGDACVRSCPSDMVPVGLAYCADRYEASRADASAESQGENDSVALSRPGVLPWMVNPMTEAHLVEFQAACAAAGKHLCRQQEWLAACTGPSQTAFVYGNTFNRETCNCVDTFCDEYCAEHLLSEASCKLSADCGYSYDCFRVMPTGHFPGCTNEYGTFDMNGNVWEVVLSNLDARGYEVRGGAFNCASASTRVNCSFNASWSALFAGFRCCKEL